MSEFDDLKKKIEFTKNKNKINKNFAEKIVSFLKFVKSKRKNKINKKNDKIYKGCNK